MRRYVKKSTLSYIKVFELIGKPILFIIKALVSGLATYFHLLKLFGIQVKWLVHKITPKRRKKKHSKNKSVFKIKYLVFLSTFSLACFACYFYILKDLPDIHLLSSSTPSLTTKIYDRNNVLLYKIYKDENRSLIRLSSLPAHLIDATLAAEDKNFYHHFGLDPIGLARAVYNNLINCKLKFVSCTLQGGSTITQQLIKNTILTPEKTFSRKIKEAILALEAEYYYDKDTILEMYLNQVSYGGTAYGIEQASWQYFGKSSSDLTLAESALLAGLPISPTTLSPFGTNPYLAKIRQQQVLESMVEAKSISENDKLAALGTPIVLGSPNSAILAPHFVMYVKDLLVSQLGESIVSRGGLEVHTTLDYQIQKVLEQEIDKELSNLNKLNVKNAAGLVISPQNGEILAMVGSHDFFDYQGDGQVNVVQQKRQPGSAIKPITYALALESGASPSTYIDDSPICFKNQGQPDYCPKNYDGKFHGQVTLKTALASSYNIPAVKLLNSYGLSNMIELAKTLGITTWDDPSRYGLSLTLGGGEITMLDLASVYAVFASGGIKTKLHPVISIQNSAGKDISLKDTSLPGKQVLSPSVAYQISSMLSDPKARAPAFGTNSVLNLPGSGVAVKTGTTNNLRDNWTFGYTPNLLVATWVGNNDNTPMSSVASGITGASPIWARTMKTLLSDQEKLAFEAPSSMVKINTSCSGKPAYEYFIEGQIPRVDCSKKIGKITETAASTSQ